MQLAAQNYIRQYESLHGNTVVRLYRNYDNHLIYTTGWSKFIYKLDANLNVKWRIEPRGAKTIANSYVFPHDSGLYLFGAQDVFNYDRYAYDESYLWINKLDACNNKIWSRLIVRKEVFTDTSFFYAGYHDFASIDRDEKGNLYFMVSSENMLYPNDSLNGRTTSLLYKLTPDGELVYRVPIFNVYNKSVSAFNTHCFNDKLYISGNAMLADMHKYPDRVNFRAFLQLVDTSGKLIKHTDFSSDQMYFCEIEKMKFNPYTKKLLAAVIGRRIDTVNLTDIYENNLILYDSMLNELKRITIDETQYGYGNYAAIDVDTAGNFLIAFINTPPVDTIFEADDRPSKLYFLRMNHNLEIIDSVHIDFLPHKNLNDTATFIDRIVPNPQNPAGYIMSGMRAYGKNPFHRILFRVSPDLKLDTSTYPATAKDYYCNETLTNKIISLEFTDTIYIVTEHKRAYKSPYNSVLDLDVYTAQIVLSPNPATTQVHITSPVKLESYTINNTSGTQLQSGVLDNDNNIDISQLPQGLYFLQVQLENGQTVTKKLVRSY
jgi:hypothetical protein